MKVMKMKKLFFIVAITVGLTTLMSTTCKKDEPETPVTCNGFVSASSTGKIINTYCFNALVSYDYVSGESLSLLCRQDGDPIYSCLISINPVVGPGTYNVSSIDPGYVELNVHGDENEFYKSEQGTITITEISSTTIKGTFSVTTVGYYNKATVNVTGSFSM